MSRGESTAHAAPLPQECTLLDELPGRTVRVRFKGTFEGAPITWEATLEALAGKARAFIDVEEAALGCGRLRVGVPAETIDHATLHKCIIMVRQYRALRRGRHEFGPQTH